MLRDQMEADLKVKFQLSISISLVIRKAVDHHLIRDGSKKNSKKNKKTKITWIR